jgi:hypothetical protein
VKSALLILYLDIKLKYVMHCLDSQDEPSFVHLRTAEPNKKMTGAQVLQLVLCFLLVHVTSKPAFDQENSNEIHITVKMYSYRPLPCHSHVGSKQKILPSKPRTEEHQNEYLTGKNNGFILLGLPHSHGVIKKLPLMQENKVER